MKKAVFIFFVFTGAFVHAQNPIPNSSFEDWTNYGNYSDPAGWQSDNYVTAGFGIIPVESDTLPEEGLLCAKLVTKGGTQGDVTLPAILCTGTFNSTLFICEGGFPCPQTYNYFNGYAMYNPKDTDKAGLAAYFYKWNGNTGKIDTIAVAFTALAENTGTSYIYFSIPFSFLTLATPDSASVILTSTVNLGNHPPKGSKLRVDNIEFSDITGIDETVANPARVYPNPANDKMIFQMPPTPEQYTLNIYDGMGREMKKILLETNHYQINTAVFPPGVFYYNVTNNAGKIASSGYFLVQH